MTSLFTNSEQILSCGKSGDDDLFGDSASGGDGATAEAGQVIAVSTGDLLDEAEVAQASEITGDAGGRQMGKKRFQVGTTHTTDVELRTLQGAQQRMLGLVEEVEALDAMAIDLFGRGQFVEAATTGREVVERGEKFEIAAVAAEENLAQIDQAVNRLLDGGQFPGGVSIPVFHLAVVLEEGNIVGRGLDAQHTTEFVVHLDRVLAHAMLDAGAFDARGQAAIQFLRQLRRHPLAQKAHHLLGLDRENRLARNCVVERLHRRLGAEGQIRRALDLHQAPVIGLTEDVKHRAAFVGVAIKNAVQHVRGKTVCQLLRPLPVVDADEGVVGHGVVDACRQSVAGQASYGRCSRTGAGTGTRSAHADKRAPTRRR